MICAYTWFRLRKTLSRGRAGVPVTFLRTRRLRLTRPEAFFFIASTGTHPRCYAVVPNVLPASFLTYSP